MGATGKKQKISFCELRVNSPHCASDWTIRQLDGKWLVESATYSCNGAAFRDDLEQAVGFAMDCHETWDDPPDF